MNQRQPNRRASFQLIFAQMPLWETWATITPCDSGFRDEDGERILIDVKRNHCKSIPRRLRRSMARARVRGEWGAVYGGGQ